MSDTHFGANHHAHADNISGSIKSIFGGHEPGYHYVKPHIRVNHDNTVSHIPGHLQSDPNGFLGDNLSFHPTDFSHGHSFDSVMVHNDPLLHYSEYHTPSIKF